MSGTKSRSKGRREEQGLVLYLASLGYKAERILRQYQFAGQADVKATKGDTTYTFEMKSRRGNFKTIYDLYFNETGGKGPLSFVLCSSGTPVAMSTRFEDLLKSDWHFVNLVLFPPAGKQLKVYERIVGLEALKQTADFLVIRDNNKPRLFLRYW